MQQNAFLHADFPASTKWFIRVLAGVHALLASLVMPTFQMPFFWSLIVAIAVGALMLMVIYFILWKVR